MTPDRLEYAALNAPVLGLVPTSARRVLDAGCGVGSLGRAIKARQPAEVVGVTVSADEAGKATAHLDRVVVADLDAFDPAGLGAFDCVVCSHVLEHLLHPDRFLRAVRSTVAPGGRVIVALPNVLFWRQRVRFARGRFRYTDGGLMDRTHYRFFDWGSAQELVTAAGYRLAAVVPDGGFPLSRHVPGLGRVLDAAALRLAPGLFAWQVVMAAEPAGDGR